nr:MAG TPA: hypothetical protein [Caudoviricetes sp.]
MTNTFVYCMFSNLPYNLPCTILWVNFACLRKCFIKTFCLNNESAQAVARYKPFSHVFPNLLKIPFSIKFLFKIRVASIACIRCIIINIIDIINQICSVCIAVKRSRVEIVFNKIYTGNIVIHVDFCGNAFCISNNHFKFSLSC